MCVLCFVPLLCLHMNCLSVLYDYLWVCVRINVLTTCLFYDSMYVKCGLVFCVCLCDYIVSLWVNYMSILGNLCV